MILLTSNKTSQSHPSWRGRHLHFTLSLTCHARFLCKAHNELPATTHANLSQSWLHRDFLKYKLDHAYTESLQDEVQLPYQNTEGHQELPNFTLRCSIKAYLTTEFTFGLGKNEDTWVGKLWQTHLTEQVPHESLNQFQPTPMSPRNSDSFFMVSFLK
jgi:hypothetical protein